MDFYNRPFYTNDSVMAHFSEWYWRDAFSGHMGDDIFRVTLLIEGWIFRVRCGKERKTKEKDDR